MKNILKEKISRGGKALGTFFELGGATAVECLGLSGLDFMIIDTEHGPFDVESAMDFVRAAERRDITPLVRVKDSTRPSILKMLDIGAHGLIIPCVHTVEEARKLVEFGKYYPLGMRGFAHSRSSGFGFEDFAQDVDSYFETCNSKTMILPQCETKGCLDKIEEIAALEGVDGIFIGPYDLSIALGKPARFDDEEITAAITRILKACKSAGKFAFIYTAEEEAARGYFDDGFDAVAYGMDAIVYINAFKQLVDRLTLYS